MEYLQSSFLGGLNQQLDATKIPALGNSYYLGINVRPREDVLEPIRSPLNLTSSIPSGKLQGIYGAGSFLVLFIAGIPYVRNVGDANTGFIALSADPLDGNVDYIYAEFVPGSTIGYGRLQDPTSGEIVLDLDRDLPFVSSNQGLIYQDGISNNARLIRDNSLDVDTISGYANWILENRQYVPTMKQMLYYSGILFGISPDGKQIYHSVSGKPLDFVIPVNEDGDKVSSSEEEGGAPATSKRLDFEVITSIRSAQTESTLSITTLSKTFLAPLDYTNTIFAEPQIGGFQISSAGAVNQFCFADLNGDTAVISTTGIYSFNASSILKQESSNDSVSGKISRLFSLSPDNYVTQDYPCAYDFGTEYSFFAVNTIYGRGVLVYDKVLDTFVSLDMYDGVSQIKQFASVVINNRRRLFFITTDNMLFEAFAGEGVEEAGILPGEWCSNNPRVDNNPTILRLVFTECEDEGTVTVTPIVNRREFSEKSETLRARTTPKTIPISVPFGGSDNDTAQVVTFNLFGTVMSGWKMAMMINWNVKAKLTHISMSSETQTAEVNQKQKASRNATLSA